MWFNQTQARNGKNRLFRSVSFSRVLKFFILVGAVSTSKAPIICNGIGQRSAIVVQFDVFAVSYSKICNVLPK